MRATDCSKKAWMKTSDGRIEMPDYPERAVMEGIVNALIHRCYREVGSEVHIDMFDDRIEIYSPEGMVSGISLKDKDIMKIPSKKADNDDFLLTLFNMNYEGESENVYSGQSAKDLLGRKILRF